MKKVVYFDGIKFNRDDKTGYYLSTRKVDGRQIRLHRYVWQYYNGKIPKGYHIHHKDHDKSNNDISNLELIPASEHMALHEEDRAKNEEFKRWKIKNLDEKARPKASEWHRSKDGRAWHREHAKRTLLVKNEREYNCEHCGSAFTSTKPVSVRFCSNKCKSAWRRKQGPDDVERICAYCGDEFKVNKFSKVKTCSLSCANKLRHQKAKRS